VLLCIRRCVPNQSAMLYLEVQYPRNILRVSQNEFNIMKKIMIFGYERSRTKHNGKWVMANLAEFVICYSSDLSVVVLIILIKILHGYKVMNSFWVIVITLEKQWFGPWRLLIKMLIFHMFYAKFFDCLLTKNWNKVILIFCWFSSIPTNVTKSQSKSKS